MSLMVTGLGTSVRFPCYATRVFSFVFNKCLGGKKVRDVPKLSQLMGKSHMLLRFSLLWKMTVFSRDAGFGGFLSLKPRSDHLQVHSMLTSQSHITFLYFPKCL